MVSFVGVSKIQLHDYYHNTWVKRFYADTAIYREELKVLVREHITATTQELLKMFLSRHSSENVNKRQIQ